MGQTPFAGERCTQGGNIMFLKMRTFRVPGTAGQLHDLAPAAAITGERAVVESLGATVFDRNPLPMAVVDGAGVVLAANPALARYLGLDPNDVVGTSIRDQDCSAPTSWVQPGAGDRRLRHASGHDLWAAVSAVSLPEVDDGAALVCLHDATGRHNTEQMLLHAAMHDSLTDLPNRRLLRDRLDTALSRAVRTSARVAVLFVDLDGFKAVNDTWGHDAGDELLVSVAGGILGALRSCDTVARLGGDEFVVVCEDLDADEDLDALVARLLAGISTPVELNGTQVVLSASVGVALAQRGGGQADELLRLADLAMLAAKSSPHAAYVVVDPTHQDELAAGVIDLDRRTLVVPLHERSSAYRGGPTVGDARWSTRDLASPVDEESTPQPADLSSAADSGPAPLLGDLSSAIAADLLVLHYQPVVRVDGLVVGLEALLRWPHPGHGLLLPQDFLPEVADSEVADELSDWVLRTAIRDAASWHDPGLRVSVNVWAAQVARPGFLASLETMLGASGLTGRSLYVELHDRDLRAAAPEVAAALHGLRRLGVGVAVDDLGAAHRSDLLDRRRSPVDTVKVRREVLAGAAEDREHAITVAAVAMTARAAGRVPVAMGVETVEQLALVRELGYDMVQGHLSGPPASLLDLRGLIVSRRVELPATSGEPHPCGAGTH